MRRSAFGIPNPGHARISALALAPIGDLMAWAKEGPAELLLDLVDEVDMLTVDGHGGMGTPSTFLLAVLETFGEREDVRRQIAGKLRPLATVGGIAEYYDNRLALVEKLPDFGKPQIASWKPDVAAAFVLERDAAKQVDAEMEGGIY